MNPARGTPWPPTSSKLEAVFRIPFCRLWRQTQRKVEEVASRLGRWPLPGKLEAEAKAGGGTATGTLLRDASSYETGIACQAPRELPQRLPSASPTRDGSLDRFSR